MLIVMKIVGWAQWVSGSSLGLGMEVGQSLGLWLVAVVDSLEERPVSKHHWETVTRMVGRVVCGSVSLGKLLMSLLRFVEVHSTGGRADGKCQSPSRIAGEVGYCWGC